MRFHAAHIGHFEMEWHMLCAFCAHVFKSFAELKSVYNHFVCDFCYAENTPALDDYIHVVFTLNPEIRDHAYRRPESLSAEDLYYRFHFSKDVVGMLDGMPLYDFLVDSTSVLTYLAPGETLTSDLVITPGIFTGKDLGTSAGFTLFVGEEAEAERREIVLEHRDGRYEAVAPPLVQLRIEYGAAMFNFDRCTQMPGGPINLEVRNDMDQRNSLLVLQYPPDLVAVPLAFHPALTGKNLLSNQTFRNLFRTEAIGSEEGLAVKDLTHLFTDHTGTTALYDRVGDTNAYALVRRHFEALGAVTAEHGGAIVKTIGDSIHATFPDPAKAVRAALGMMAALDTFNRDSAETLELKIGLHRGHSLAVMLNERIDYFGQAVNIAARLQGLAGACEICLSADVHDSPGVGQALLGHNVEPAVGIMKGVSGELPVYRVAVPCPGANSAPDS